MEYAGWDGLFLSLSSVASLHADYFSSELQNFRSAERSMAENEDGQAHGCLCGL